MQGDMWDSQEDMFMGLPRCRDRVVIIAAAVERRRARERAASTPRFTRSAPVK